MPGAPSLRVEAPGSIAWKVTSSSTTEYGLKDPMNGGIEKITSEVKVGRHPLEYSEKHYHENQGKNDMMLLRNSQGLHAPLRLMMERKVASKVQRLPGMASSNLMFDILTGRLDDIEFADILNDPMEAEIVGQPHVVMERRSGL